MISDALKAFQAMTGCGEIFMGEGIKYTNPYGHEIYLPRAKRPTEDELRQLREELDARFNHVMEDGHANNADLIKEVARLYLKPR